ncbi:MAG: thiamine diphosphokinase [Puniceicoccales bacterium]|jgi:thiamine pyrophosphokinase|nr:thiamine diphosphokinase [Puniceicoccales bacterium]
MLDEDKQFLTLLPSLGVYRSLLCLSGTLPDGEFFSHFDLPIIAADGASNLLSQRGIIADVVIGDWDSVREPVAARTKKVIIRDQSSSDFQKALKFIQENHLSPSIVLGINGGYMDHILNNVSILAQTDSIGYMSPNLGFVVRHDWAFNFPIGTKLSLFGMPSGRIDTRGLRWELKDQELHFPEYSSCFNRTVAERVEFDIGGGAIFLVIYLNDVVDGGSVGMRN